MPTAFEVEVSVSSIEERSEKAMESGPRHCSNDSSETGIRLETGPCSKESATGSGTRSEKGNGASSAAGIRTEAVAENSPPVNRLQPAENSLETELSEGVSRLLLDDTTRMDETTLLNDTTRLNETASSCNSSIAPDQPKTRREVVFYRDKPEICKIRTLISNFKNRYPGKLRDYTSMTAAEKDREHERIMKLLGRLKIRNAPHNMENEDEFQVRETGADAVVDNLVNNDVADYDDKSAIGGDFSPCKDEGSTDVSQALLSVDTEPHEHCVARFAHRSNNAAPGEPVRPGSPSVSLSSSDSIEVARAAVTSNPSYSNIFESPDLQRQRSSAAKRVASTSGQRDSGRLRYKRSEGNTPSPSQFLQSQLNNYSPECMQPFIASQSPISPHCRQPMLDDDDDSPFDTESKMPVPLEGPIMDHGTVKTHDTINSFGQGRGDSDRAKLREISANVALKNGVPFHLGPLQMKRTKKNRQIDPDLRERCRPHFLSLPDPLDSYSRNESEQLNRIFSWMRDSSLVAPSDARGIIFSLMEREIIDVTVKLLLETQSDPSQRGMVLLEDENIIPGQTVIVTRNKEEIAEWERALREYTSFSVLNHPSLTVRERKSPSTATKCAAHDVVLSTYEYIKSWDIALPLDDDGHVETQNIGCEDGWYSSRHGSQNGEAASQCKQLSVLHRLNWRQVIFVDILGRKCFLAKSETARCSAARALNADSRFIFFQNSDLKRSPLESLIRSDRNALRSVASVLRIESEDPEETVLEMVIDKND